MDPSIPRWPNACAQTERLGTTRKSAPQAAARRSGCEGEGQGGLAQPLVARKDLAIDPTSIKPVVNVHPSKNLGPWPKLSGSACGLAMSSASAACFPATA